MEEKHTRKRCEGRTKKSASCKNFPIKGDTFCRTHSTTFLHKVIKVLGVLSGGSLLAIGFFIYNLYSDSQMESRLSDEYKVHSFAERSLSSQYNLPELQRHLDAFVNLINVDPDFRKEFYIDAQDKLPKLKMLLHDRDFRIDFVDRVSESEFSKFLSGASRDYALHEDAYNYFYVIQDGNTVDSFSNNSLVMTRNFPILPPVRISTIDPTDEYLCTSFLDVQIDSVVEGSVYLSNGIQENTFKVRLKYSESSRAFSFDQINDIWFDHKSAFYSIAEEISYYEFMSSLFGNAKVLIRHASSGYTIYESNYFIPHNIDLSRSMESFNLALIRLHYLQRIENHWGIRFTRSDVSKEESMILRGIEISSRTCSKVIGYPFEFLLDRHAAEKFNKDSQRIAQSGGEIICDDYTVNVLGHELNIGRIHVVIPRSLISQEEIGEFVRFGLIPRNDGGYITYEFLDLKSSFRPDLITHLGSSDNRSDSSVIFVEGMSLVEASWENTGECE